MTCQLQSILHPEPSSWWSIRHCPFNHWSIHQLYSFHFPFRLIGRYPSVIPLWRVVLGGILLRSWEAEQLMKLPPAIWSSCTIAPWQHPANRCQGLNLKWRDPAGTWVFANLHYNPWAFTGFYYGMSICVLFSISVCLVFSRGFLICSEPMPMLSSCRFRDFNGSTPSTTCTSFFAMLHVCQGVICCLKAVIWGGMIYIDLRPIQTLWVLQRHVR